MDAKERHDALAAARTFASMCIPSSRQDEAAEGHEVESGLLIIDREKLLERVRDSQDGS